MRFFEAMPATTGCAFLVVMHLLADRESMLATLIGRRTKMSVTQAEQDTLLEPDCVYIAPPGLYIELDRGRIALQPFGRRGPKATGVDHCMASVAADQGARTIGVVLTGLDSDGTIGVKAIKAEGGFTIAQLASEAAHPEMPRNALATGLVDCELQRWRPDVVLLDIGMPDADGYEVATQLRQLPEMAADAAYIAITGFGRPEDFARSVEAGFFRHLVKPVDPSVLESVLQEASRARAP